VTFDFFRNITTTYFKPPKPTMERLEQRQEEWRRKYMPYATRSAPPKSPTPSPPSQLPPSAPTRVVKPSSPPITSPRISPPKIPSIHDIMGLSQQIRSELRREGVPVWYYTGKLQMPTPQKIWKGVQYITGFASKLAERTERKYESVVVQPVLKKIAPKGETPVEQVKRGVVGGLVRTPIAVTGIPMLRMGFKGVATPSGLRKEFGEMVEYAKKRPFEVGAETATTLITGGLAGRAIRVREPFEVGAFERVTGKLTRRYIPKERIVPEGLKFSTLRMPKTTPAEVMKRIMEEREFKLSGRAEEVWHAAKFRRFKPSLIRGISEVPPGYSPVKGTYVAPAAYPAFATPKAILLTGAKIPKELRFEFEPTFFRIMTKGIRIPKRVRVTPKEIAKARELIGEERLAQAPYSPKLALKRFAEYKKYVEEKAPKGYAYVSPEVTAKLPWRGELEVEAVIPVGTKVKESLMSRMFPKFTEERMIIAKPTFRGELALRRFYRQVRKGLKMAKTEEEKQAYLEGVSAMTAKVIKELQERGWLKAREGRVKIKVRSLRTFGEERATPTFSKLLKKSVMKEEMKKIGDARERFMRRGEFEVISIPRSVRVGVWMERGIFGASSVFHTIMRKGFKDYQRRIERIHKSYLSRKGVVLGGRRLSKGKVMTNTFKTTKTSKRVKGQAITSTSAVTPPSTISPFGEYLRAPIRRRESRAGIVGVSRAAEQFLRGSRVISSTARGSRFASIMREGVIGTQFLTLTKGRKKRKTSPILEQVMRGKNWFDIGASKFFKITPIATPEELLKGVLRR